MKELKENLRNIAEKDVCPPGRAECKSDTCSQCVAQYVLLEIARCEREAELELRARIRIERAGLRHFRSG